jgi:hypothetical protein
MVAGIWRFYADLLGLEHVADMPMSMSIGGGGAMHRVQCGDLLLRGWGRFNTPSDRRR